MTVAILNLCLTRFLHILGSKISFNNIDKIPKAACIIGNIEVDNIIYKEPSAIDVANYAFNNHHLAGNGRDIEPIYIRPPDAIVCG